MMSRGAGPAKGHAGESRLDAGGTGTAGKARLHPGRRIDGVRRCAGPGPAQLLHLHYLLHSRLLPPTSQARPPAKCDFDHNFRTQIRILANLRRML